METGLGTGLNATCKRSYIVSMVLTVPFRFYRSMIADSAIIGFVMQRVIFVTTYLWLEVSYVSTRNEVKKFFYEVKNVCN